MASLCKLQRDQPSIMVKIKDIAKKTSECLCLLCYYFCSGNKDFQSDFAKHSLIKTATAEKQFVPSSSQNCSCAKPVHKDLVVRAIDFIEACSNRATQHKLQRRRQRAKNNQDEHVYLASQFSLVAAWEISLINEILAAKEGDHYLYQLHQPHVFFFKTFNKFCGYIKNKTFKWASMDSKDIAKLTVFINNIGIWSAIRTPRQDLHPFTSRVTLEYIGTICNFRVKTIGGQSNYDSSQQFYSKLLKFYKEAYIHKRLARAEPMEILGLERMTPLSRIELRDINRTEFARYFPGIRGDIHDQRSYSDNDFNPAAFCLKCIDEFIIDFSFGFVNLMYRADQYSVEVAALLFRYGVLDLKTAMAINELLYEKVENLKTQEQALERYYQFEHNRGFPQKEKEQMILDRAASMVKMRQLIAEILFYMMFHKQDESIGQLFRLHRLEDEQERDSDNKKINEAFFDEMTAKKLVEVVFGYFLEDRKIGPLSLISSKVMRISKNFLFIFAKANDVYLTGLNLIRDKELGRYLLSENKLDQTKPHEIRLRIENLFREFYSSKICLFDLGRLNANMSEILKQLNDFLQIRTTGEGSLRSAGSANKKEKLLSPNARVMQRQDDQQNADDNMIADNAPQQEFVIDVKDYKFRRYKCQRQIYRQNIVFDLIMILNDFHDALDKDVVKRFLQVLKLIFKSNTTLLSVLLNERTLDIMLEKATQSPDLFVEFLCKLFDGDWLCQTDSKIIRKVLDFYKDECNRYSKKIELVSSRSNLINILEFLRNWESDEKKAKIFHTFLSTDNMDILEVILNNIHHILPKQPEQIVRILDTRSDPERDLLDAFFKRVAALLESNFTKDVFLMSRNRFPLPFLEKCILGVKSNLSAKSNLFIIFENLYINENESNIAGYADLIGDRQLDEKVEKLDFREDNNLNADYGAILRILLKLLEECLQKDLNAVVDPVLEKRFVFECLLTGILRLVKSILNLPQTQTKHLRPYVRFELMQMIEFRILMDKLASSEHQINNLIGYCRKQQLNLYQKLAELSDKLELLDTETAMARQPLMVANVIKKMCLAWMSGQPVERPKYYITPKHVNDFKLKLISNEIAIRLSTLKGLQRKLQGMKQSESVFLYTLRLTYLKQKILKLTQHQENPYLNFMSEIEVKKDVTDTERSDEQRIFTNLSRFILNNLFQLKKQPRQRNQIYIFIEFVCNIFYFATKPAQVELMRVWKQQKNELQERAKKSEGKGDKKGNKKGGDQPQENSTPNFIEDLWQEIINTWNYVTKKVNQNNAWCDEATKLMMLLKLCQYLAEDNCQPWKTELGLTQIRGMSLIELLYSMEEHMIEQNQWNRRGERFHLDELTFRNKEYLFDVVFAIQDLKTQLIIGPNYQNIGKLTNKSYRNMRDVLKRYTKDPLSPLSDMKLNIMEYLSAMKDSGSQDIREDHLRNFSLDAFELLYVNYVKQAYYSVRYPKEYDKLTSVKMVPLSMRDFDDLKATFIKTSDLSSHPLLKAACKIYAYINTLAFEKPMVEIFVRDRDINVSRYGARKATLEEQVICCWKFLSEITIGVEVVRHFTPDEMKHRHKSKQGEDSQLLLYYFKVAGDAIYLSQQTKSQFENNVDRTSGQTKVQELFETFEVFEEEISHNKKKFRGKQRLFRLIQNIYYCEIVSYVLTVLLNCMYLAQQQSGGLDGMPTAIIVVSILHLVWNTLVYVFYAVFRLPLDYHVNEFNLKRRERIKRLTTTQKFKIGLQTVIMNGSFILLLYIVFVALAMALKPWFIAFNLLMIVNLNETMNYVLKSVTRYREQLVMTYIFGLIIVYFFALLNYTQFASKFQTTPADPTQPGPTSSNTIIGGPDSNEAFCSGLLPCYLNVVNSAIRSGNGIVALQTTQSFTSQRFAGTWFNSLFFFYLINIFMLNIIFGIIISTFGTLRSEQSMKDDDRNNICFMCHLNRSEFEKYKRSFRQHQLEHDKWKYVFFLHMMRKKTYKDCDALENYLKDRIEKKSVDWMPLGQSKSLAYAKKESVHENNDKDDEQCVLDKEMQDEMQQQLKKAVEEMQAMLAVQQQKQKEW